MLLSDKQRQVVECLSNCLAVACPGSGKTRVLVQKVEHILKVDPGCNILITSFTQDSAAEIRKRIVSAVGRDAARKVASGTFHSIALDQLKRTGFNGTIIGSGQMKQYIERALAECKLFDFDLDEAVSLIEMAKLTPDYEPANDNHGRLFMAYSALTERNNVIDFADMLSRTVRKMRSGELPPKNCKYLMTDESQDLDEMQYAWCAEHIKAGAIFTVVGDDDQSIYKFRNALGYEGMMRFQRDFGAELIKLDTNYRCHSEILDSAGKVILNNTNRVEKALVAERGPGGNVEAWCCHESDHEINFVIGKILQSCEFNPNPNPDEHLVGILEGEWAVLARNNHNLSELAMAMVAYGIPHIYQGKNLWDDRPVCLVLGLLSSLVTGKKAGFDAALHFAGMDEPTLKQLHKDFGDDFAQMFYGGQLSFDKYGKGTAENLKKFAEKVPQWGKALSKERVANVVRGAFDWFIDHLESNRDDKKNKGGYQRDFKRLSAAKSIMANMSGDLPSRLKRVMSKPDDDKDKDKKKQGVHLGTLHSGKGLEFKNVWLLQMDDGVMPDIKEWTPEIHEEERRLFYVGMTRAKNCLYMSCTKSPSSFIQETGIDLKSIFAEGISSVDIQEFKAAHKGN